MVPAALSADEDLEGDWVCLECEELDEDESQWRSRERAGSSSRLPEITDDKVLGPRKLGA
jgi:hypothetical protein